MTLAQVKGHVEAIQRMKAVEVVMQMHALRIAAWGDEDSLKRYQNRLLGKPSLNSSDEALAAFGVRLECSDPASLWRC